MGHSEGYKPPQEKGAGELCRMKVSTEPQIGPSSPRNGHFVVSDVLWSLNAAQNGPNRSYTGGWEAHKGSHMAPRGSLVHTVRAKGCCTRSEDRSSSCLSCPGWILPVLSPVRGRDSRPAARAAGVGTKPRFKGSPLGVRNPRSSAQSQSQSY